MYKHLDLIGGEESCEAWLEKGEFPLKRTFAGLRKCLESFLNLRPQKSNLAVRVVINKPKPVSQALVTSSQELFVPTKSLGQDT